MIYGLIFLNLFFIKIHDVFSLNKSDLPLSQAVLILEEILKHRYAKYCHCIQFFHGKDKKHVWVKGMLPSHDIKNDMVKCIRSYFQPSIHVHSDAIKIGRCHKKKILKRTYEDFSDRSSDEQLMNQLIHKKGNYEENWIQIKAYLELTHYFVFNFLKLSPIDIYIRDRILYVIPKKHSKHSEVEKAMLFLKKSVKNWPIDQYKLV
jgi:hypothetical protein